MALLYDEMGNVIGDANSETAGDAVNTNPNPATQNTGTDSGGSGTPTTATEEKKLNPYDPNGYDSEDSSTFVVPKTTAPLPGSGKASVDDVPKSGSSSSVSVGGSSAISYTPRDNPLHSYASYTYGLSLHVLSADTYKKMMDNPKNTSAFTVKNLVSSANRYSTSRDAAFTDDFYFDGLKMTTIIGMNSGTRGSNAVEITFNLIEPYGMTLLNRILDINTKELNARNYLEMPYLIEINFFGIDDNGKNGILPDLTKFIPIKLTEMKIRASTKGTEYAIKAVPFTHQGHFDSVQATKANFEVTATTVGDFFKNSTDTGTTSAVASAFNTSNKATQAPPTDARTSTGTTGQGSTNTGTANANANINQSKPPSVKTMSYTAAYNAWNKKEQENGNIGVADQIDFVFDPAIAGAKIVEKNKNTVDKTSTIATASTTAKGNDPKTQSVTPATGPNFDKQVFAINAGTSVTDVVNMVVVSSEFIRKQLINTETEKASSNAKSTGTSAESLSAAKGGGPVDWFKIIPKIELLAFDNIRNKWGKKITFYVKPYKYYNSSDPRAPKSQPSGSVKDYQYIYTGHNRDIIEFDMDFNTLYYTAINTSRSKTEALNKSQGANENAIKSKGEEAMAGSPVPTQKEVISGSQQATAGGSVMTSGKQNAASAAQSFYSSSKGDMLSLNLKILGDPDFIKQDDILYNPGNNVDNKGQFIGGNNGSLAMDSGEIFCKVTFKTPVDFDENTGLLRTNSKYTDSYFSGFYKVMTVDSEFKGGKFTQALEMVRYPDQAQDAKIGSASSTNSTVQRTQDKTLTTDKTSSPKVSGSTVDKTNPAIIPGETGDISANNVTGASSESQGADTPGQTAKDINADPFADTTTVNDTVTPDLKDVADNGPTVQINESNSDSNGEPIIP